MQAPNSKKQISKLQPDYPTNFQAFKILYLPSIFLKVTTKCTKKLWENCVSNLIFCDIINNNQNIHKHYFLIL